MVDFLLIFVKDDVVIFRFKHIRTFGGRDVVYLLKTLCAYLGFPPVNTDIGLLTIPI